MGIHSTIIVRPDTQSLKFMVHFQICNFGVKYNDIEKDET